AAYAWATSGPGSPVLGGVLGALAEPGLDVLPEDLDQGDDDRRDGQDDHHLQGLQALLVAVQLLQQVHDGLLVGGQGCSAGPPGGNTDQKEKIGARAFAAKFLISCQ